MSRYDQIYDGEWYDQPRKDRIACCDCGLVHDVEWRRTRRGLDMKSTRNNRATAAMRRHLSVELVPKRRKR